jgi:hypothetical protein
MPQMNEAAGVFPHIEPIPTVTRTARTLSERNAQTMPYEAEA